MIDLTTTKEEILAKTWSRIQSFRSDGIICGQLQEWAMDKLDRACTNVDDQMMLVQQLSRDRVMSWRDFWWFLGQNADLKRIRKDSVAKKWLHCRTGVLARVSVHFLAVGVAWTKQESWAPVHVQACIRHRCFWLQFISFCANTLSAGRARALAYAHRDFFHYPGRGGTQVKGFSQIIQATGVGPWP